MRQPEVASGSSAASAGDSRPVFTIVLRSILRRYQELVK